MCGVIFIHENEKTLYVAGDTVWYEGVQEVIDTHNPEIIVANARDNQFLEGGSHVMGKDNVYEVHNKAAPAAKIIACKPFGSCQPLDIIKRRTKKRSAHKKAQTFIRL